MTDFAGGLVPDPREMREMIDPATGLPHGRSPFMRPSEMPVVEPGNVAWQVHDADGKLVGEGEKHNAVTTFGRNQALRMLQVPGTPIPIAANRHFNALNVQLILGSGPQLTTVTSRTRADVPAGSNTQATLTYVATWRNVSSGTNPDIRSANLWAGDSSAPATQVATVVFDTGQGPDVGQGATLTLTWTLNVSYRPDTTYDDTSVSSIKDTVGDMDLPQLWTPQLAINWANALSRLMWDGRAASPGPTVLSHGRCDFYAEQSGTQTPPLGPFPIQRESESNAGRRLFTNFRVDSTGLRVVADMTWIGPGHTGGSTNPVGAGRWYQLRMGDSVNLNSQRPFGAGYLNPQTAWPTESTTYTVGVKFIVV